MSVSYNDAGKPLYRVCNIRDITERKKAEEALKESEERFRVAQELSPDGFTILQPVRDAAGQIIDFTWLFENAAVARFNGTETDKVIGKRLLELFPGHRDSEFFRVYRQVAETGKPAVFESDYGGESFPYRTWFRIAVVPTMGNIAILAEDVTDRKKAEESLKESEERFRVITETSPIAIGVVDAEDRTFRFVNPAYEKMYGYNQFELPGTKSKDIYADAADRELVLRRLKENGYISDYEMKLKKKDGSTFWGLVSVSPINFGGEPALLGISVDITERKKVEELKDDFIGMVSHELRTPLTIIMGAVKVALSEGISEDDLKVLLLEAEEGSEDLAHILDNLLELSRYQANRMQLSKSLLMSNKRCIILSISSEKFNASHKIFINIEPELPYIDVDKVRLERIIKNLVDNAVKYSPDNTK